jgi:hypothetical protein
LSNAERSRGLVKMARVARDRPRIWPRLANKYL